MLLVYRFRVWIEDFWLKGGDNGEREKGRNRKEWKVLQIYES